MTVDIVTRRAPQLELLLARAAEWGAEGLQPPPSGGFRGGGWSWFTPPLAHAKIIFKDHEMLLTFLMITLVLGDTCKSMLRNSKRQLSLYESFDIISKKGKQIIYY